MVELILDGLNCANCAEKIRSSVAKLDGVSSAELLFAEQKLRINCEHPNEIIDQVKIIVKKIEPDVKVLEKTNIRAKSYEHEHGQGRSKGVRFLAGLAIYVTAIILRQEGYSFWLFLFAYLIFGWTVLFRAFKGLLSREVFDENFLMSISTVGAFFIGEFVEGVAVMLFYQIGEFCEGLAVRRSRQSVKSLLELKPDIANLINEGEVSIVLPDMIHVGDILLVKPGEKIPLDGIVTDGSSSVDTSSLTGESVPVDVFPGKEVFSGTLNLNSVIRLRVTKDFSESTVYRILDMMETASSAKSTVESFITKFARIYTPVVVAAALLLTVLPMFFVKDAEFAFWLKKSLVFLVVSCPCALVISVPLTFFCGLGAASKRGILIKGGNYLQALAEINTVMMDKTGTLTEGVFEVTEIVPAEGLNTDEFLGYANAAEQFSNHPIARAISRVSGNQASAVTDFVEISGRGTSAMLGSDKILAGNLAFMTENGISLPREVVAANQLGQGSVVFVSKDSEFLGHIVISDRVRPQSAGAVQLLLGCGVKKLVMLTGDKKAAAEKVAEIIGITEFYAELLPQEKLEKLESAYACEPNCKIMFVGDGINDSLSLTRANVGVAMGAIGSDVAVESADVIIMNDDPSKLAGAIKLSRSVMRIVKQNIAFAISVKIVVMLLAVFGFASMWLAIFADVGVTLLVVLYSAYAYIKKYD